MTVLTVNISHSMKPGQQQSLLRRTTAHVHPETIEQLRIKLQTRWQNMHILLNEWVRYSHGVEQIGTTLASLERLKMKDSQSCAHKLL